MGRRLFPHQKSIEEKGQNGLEEERRLAYVGVTRAKKKALISFSMNRFYQGDWIDSMASRLLMNYQVIIWKKILFLKRIKMKLKTLNLIKILKLTVKIASEVLVG